MKKHLTTIIVALVALVTGYGIGSLVGSRNVNAEQINGDISGVQGFMSSIRGDINGSMGSAKGGNSYNQLLLAPENMVFSKDKADNKELQKKTVESLEIISSQSKEFKTIAVCVKGISQEELKNEIQAIIKLAKDASVGESVLKAQDAAEKIANGEKVNYSAAQKAAQTAYDGLEKQMKAGHAFIQAADAFLAGKNQADYRYIAAVRDMFVGCCGLDATLCANDAEIDYFSNINDLLTPQDMASAIMGE